MPSRFSESGPVRQNKKEDIIIQSGKWAKREILGFISVKYREKDRASEMASHWS